MPEPCCLSRMAVAKLIRGHGGFEGRSQKEEGRKQQHVVTTPSKVCRPIPTRTPHPAEKASWPGSGIAAAGLPPFSRKRDRGAESPVEK